MSVLLTSFGEVEVCHNYLIVRAKEGVDLNNRYSGEIIELVKTHMHQPFGWISDKVHSHSVDPNMVPEMIGHLPHCRCLCTVVHGQPIRDTVPVGQYFFPEGFPLASFNTMPQAIAWIEKQLSSL